MSPEVGLAYDVAFHNAGAVADQIDETVLGALLRDREQRNEMGANGRAFVESELTWPRIAERMEEAYAECCKRSRR